MPFCQGVELIVVFLGTGQHSLPNLRSNCLAAIKHPGYCGLGYVGQPCNFSHCNHSYYRVNSGVLVTDISNGFFADLAKQIETAARKRGYSIILFNSDYNPQNEPL